MTFSDPRESWLEHQREDLAHAQYLKDPSVALERITARYRNQPADKRAVIDELLAEQLSSDDETIMFIALSLIEDFRITSTLPALRKLADRLEHGTNPGAPYEWAKVNRIIATLSTA